MEIVCANIKMLSASGWLRPLAPTPDPCPWALPLDPHWGRCAQTSAIGSRYTLYALAMCPPPHLITKLTPVALLVITSWFQFFCSQWNAKTENIPRVKMLHWWLILYTKSQKAEYDYQKGIRKDSQIVRSEHTKLESVGPAPQTFSWGLYCSRPLPF